MADLPVGGYVPIDLPITEGEVLPIPAQELLGPRRPPMSMVPIRDLKPGDVLGAVSVLGIQEGARVRRVDASEVSSIVVLHLDQTVHVPEDALIPVYAVKRQEA